MKTTRGPVRWAVVTPQFAPLVAVYSASTLDLAVAHIYPFTRSIVVPVNPSSWMCVSYTIVSIGAPCIDACEHVAPRIVGDFAFSARC